MREELAAVSSNHFVCVPAKAEVTKQLFQTLTDGWRRDQCIIAKLWCVGSLPPDLMTQLLFEDLLTRVNSFHPS